MSVRSAVAFKEIPTGNETLAEVLTNGNTASGQDIIGVDNLVVTTVNGIPYPLASTFKYTFALPINNETVYAGTGGPVTVSLGNVAVVSAGLYSVNVVWELASIAFASAGTVEVIWLGIGTTNNSWTANPSTIAFKEVLDDSTSKIGSFSYLIQIPANTTYYLNLLYDVPVGTSITLNGNTFTFNTSMTFTRVG